MNMKQRFNLILNIVDIDDVEVTGDDGGNW